jgi:hypothetical protein
MPGLRTEGRREWVLAIGGPAALGAFLGSPFGARDMLADAIRLPLTCLATGALMAPSLYIGLARFDLTRLSPRDLMAAHRQALARAGLVMLGLLPAAAWFAFSSWGSANTLLSGLALAAVAACVSCLVLGRAIAADLAAGAGAQAPLNGAVEAVPTRADSDLPGMPRPLRLWHRALFIVWFGLSISVAASSFVKSL